MAKWRFRKMRHLLLPSRDDPPADRVDSPVWRNYQTRVTDARRFVEEIRIAAVLRTMEKAP